MLSHYLAERERSGSQPPSESTKTVISSSPPGVSEVPLVGQTDFAAWIDEQKEAAKKENVILDCGGGVVLDSENMTILKNTGVVIYLQASVDVIYERIKDDKNRPLLNVANPEEKISELLNKRKVFYEKANYIINTDKRNVSDICDEIYRLLYSKD